MGQTSAEFLAPAQVVKIDGTLTPTNRAVGNFHFFSPFYYSRLLLCVCVCVCVASQQKKKKKKAGGVASHTAPARKWFFSLLPVRLLGYVRTWSCSLSLLQAERCLIGELCGHQKLQLILCKKPTKWKYAPVRACLRERTTTKINSEVQWNNENIGKSTGEFSVFHIGQQHNQMYMIKNTNLKCRDELLEMKRNSFSQSLRFKLTHQMLVKMQEPSNRDGKTCFKKLDILV